MRKWRSSKKRRAGRQRRIPNGAKNITVRFINDESIIDVNVLLQSIGKSSLFRPIWEAYLNEDFQLMVSTSILFEYEEKIAEKTSPTVASNVLYLISEAINSTFVNIYYEWDAIKKDPDDNKYFDTAVSANADFIVTNDRHFDEIKKLDFPDINIISAEDFLSILKEGNDSYLS